MNAPAGTTHYNPETGEYWQATGKTGNTYRPTFRRWNEKKGQWNRNGTEHTGNIQEI